MKIEFIENTTLSLGDKIILYGKGNLGNKIFDNYKKKFDVVGFIDSDINKHEHNVISTKDALQEFGVDIKIIICIWSPLFDYNKLKSELVEMGFRFVYHFQILTEFESQAFPHYQFENITKIKKDEEKILEFYEYLSDCESRILYENLINWKLNFCNSKLKTPDLNDQYMPFKISNKINYDIIFYFC